MNAKKSNIRQIDRRTLRKLAARVIDEDDAKARLTVNAENIRLLLADPDFQEWALTLRKLLGIPINGFTPKSVKVSNWLKSRDEDIWFERISEVFLRYTKINEQYRVYVESYVVFNNDFQGQVIEPFQTYRIGRLEIVFKKLLDIFGLKSKKLPQLVLDIYSPPTEKQWKRIESEVNTFFNSFGIPHAKKAHKPTAQFDLMLVALKQKEPIDPPVEGDYPKQETDRVLIESHYFKAREDEIIKMVKQLPTQRKRAKDLLVKRLGKTEPK